MVSFWPWRRDDSSPASFEKALSALATRIAKTQIALDSTRSTSRRIRFLSTLYLSFAYLVYAIVLILVVGRTNLGSWEWTGLAGGPVGIYAVRTVVNTYFSFRIDSLAARLKDQQTERATIIQKLKDATKYDSTQQLLEKYGGAEPKGAEGKPDGPQKTPKGPNQKQGLSPSGGVKNTGRIPITPPPTANIPRPGTASPNRVPGPKPDVPPPSVRDLAASHSAEFAPNAFEPSSIPSPAQFAAYGDVPTAEGPHWYDRIMDMLLGEDETAAKNRVVLICQQCRLVNGQAPPGTRSLSEVGTWKCMACGASNGQMDEGKRIVQEVLGEKVARQQSSSKEATQGGLTDESDQDTDGKQKGK